MYYSNNKRTARMVKGYCCAEADTGEERRGRQLEWGVDRVGWEQVLTEVSNLFPAIHQTTGPRYTSEGGFIDWHVVDESSI